MRVAHGGIPHDQLVQLHRLLLEVVRSPDLAELASRLRELTEMVATALDTSEATLWHLETERAALICLDRYDRDARAHGTELPLGEREHPAYFDALRTDGVLDVADVTRDHRVATVIEQSGRSAASALDTAVFVDGAFAGALAIRAATPRTWQPAEVAFAHSVAELIAVVFHTTRRRTTEHALAAERHLLRQVLDLDPNVVYAKDRERRFILANEATAQLYGTTPRDLLARRDEELAAIPDPEAPRREHDVLTTGREARGLERLIDAQGEERWLDATRRPLVEGGRIDALVVVAIDITDARRAEAERTRLERAHHEAQKLASVGILAGGLSHALNNYLTPIMMTAETLLWELDESSQLHEDVRGVLGAAESARELLRDLLAFGRKQLLALTTIDLNDAVARGLELASPRMPAHARLELRLASVALPVEADATQLRHVVATLVLNACEAMPGGGVVTVATRLDEDVAALRVCDTGAGLTEEVRAHLFEPFFTSTELGRSTGLELAAVHGIVEQHHGAIEVTSELGQGTCIEVRLPRCDRAPAPLPAGGGDARPTAEHRTILVVEDEAAIRRLVERVLRGAGHTVLSAGDAETALQLAGAHPGAIDLLVSDVALPGASGPALHASLGERVPRVLYLSGHARAVLDDLPPGTELLQKPFTKSELLARVRALLP